MPCAEYVRLKREYESAINEERLFKTPFGVGGTKKERAKVSQELADEKQKATIAFAKHVRACEECKKE
jgi:hypothetical protein